jgi:hypothetical protein
MKLKLLHSTGYMFPSCTKRVVFWFFQGHMFFDGLHTFNLIHPFASGFAELSADLVEAAVAHCQLIVVSK